MPWSFVGRAEQIENLRSALGRTAPGTLMIMGEPGIGRTSLLSQAPECAGQRGETLCLRPSGDTPLAALRAGLPDSVPPGATPDEASAALRDHAADRRLVVVADDAHRMDQATLLALRGLARAGRALLVVTRPIRTAARPEPDPSDCLAYGLNTHKLLLPPLSGAEVTAVVSALMGGPAHLATAEALRAATGGNPRRLRTLMLDHGLARRMVLRDDQWSIDLVDGPAGPAAGGEDRARLVQAVHKAWQELAAERADQLCRLAIWRGLGDQIAPVWSVLLLLAGRVEEASAFLDSLGEPPSATTAQLAVIKAMILAIGLRRVEAADRQLLGATSVDASPPGLLAASRAWIMAVSGRTAEATEALQTLSRSDQDTAMFVHATRAAVSGDCAETVFHLRRALAIAVSCRDSWPWMAPYLKACLIDALMLTGRVSEATSAAAGFHADKPGSGWEIASLLAELIGCSCGHWAPDVAVPQARLPEAAMPVAVAS